MPGLILFYGIGVSTTVFIVFLITSKIIIPKIKDIMNRQSKIRCLCKHEYVLKRKWIGWGNDYDEYVFVCRKCGKKKSISVYENEVNK